MAAADLRRMVKSEPSDEERPSFGIEREGKPSNEPSVAACTGKAIPRTVVPVTNPVFSSSLPAFQPQYVAPVQRMDFVPSFCQTFETERRSFSDNAEDCDDFVDNIDRERSKWSRAQTDTLVNSWKEGFEELENNRNPMAWRRILRDINRRGGKKTMDQLKKKLRNLKDRFKEAKKRSKARSGTRHFPKYYDIFNDLLGAREEARASELALRRKCCGALPSPQEASETKISFQIIEPQTAAKEKTPNGTGEILHYVQKAPQNAEEREALPRRTKKKKASKSGASAQLVDFLGQMQRQQEESMKQFLDGIERIEEKSRKHTEETLLKIARIFAKRKKKKKKTDKKYESSSEEECE